MKYFDLKLFPFHLGAEIQIVDKRPHSVRKIAALYVFCDLLEFSFHSTFQLVEMQCFHCYLSCSFQTGHVFCYQLSSQQTNGRVKCVENVDPSLKCVSVHPKTNPITEKILNLLLSRKMKLLQNLTYEAFSR